MDKKSVIVVGGGIAGIQASIDLGSMGYKVYMVEKTAAIGGRMAQLDKTFLGHCFICQKAAQKDVFVSFLVQKCQKLSIRTVLFLGRKSFVPIVLK